MSIIIILPDVELPEVAIGIELSIDMPDVVVVCAIDIVIVLLISMSNAGFCCAPSLCFCWVFWRERVLQFSVSSAKGLRLAQYCRNVSELSPPLFLVLLLC
jgi:hypothetical protein